MEFLVVNKSFYLKSIVILLLILFLSYCVNEESNDPNQIICIKRTYKTNKSIDDSTLISVTIYFEDQERIDYAFKTNKVGQTVPYSLEKWSKYGLVLRKLYFGNYDPVSRETYYYDESGQLFKIELVSINGGRTSILVSNKYSQGNISMQNYSTSFNGVHSIQYKYESDGCYEQKYFLDSQNTNINRFGSDGKLLYSISSRQDTTRYKYHDSGKLFEVEGVYRKVKYIYSNGQLSKKNEYKRLAPNSKNWKVNKEITYRYIKVSDSMISEQIVFPNMQDTTFYTFSYEFPFKSKK